MTPDRGPDGRSLGHSHVERVQPPNRGYAGYYLPNLYQENYRIRTAEELDALPVESVVIAVSDSGNAVPYLHGEHGEWIWGAWQFEHQQIFADLEDDGTWLFVVYRPDMVPARRPA